MAEDVCPRKTECTQIKMRFGRNTNKTMALMAVCTSRRMHNSDLPILTRISVVRVLSKSTTRRKQNPHPSSRNRVQCHPEPRKIRDHHQGHPHRGRVPARSVSPGCMSHLCAVVPLTSLWCTFGVPVASRWFESLVDGRHIGLSP